MFDGNPAFFAIILTIIETFQNRIRKYLCRANEVNAVLFDIRFPFLLVPFELYD